MDKLLAILTSLTRYQLDYYLLLFMRVSGLMFITQLFGRRNMPNQVRIGLALALTGVFAVAYPPILVEYSTMWGFIWKAALELVFGLVFAYICNIFLTMVGNVAGFIIDMQVGMSMVNVFDPSSNQQTAISGQFINIGFMLYFFAVGGHHKLIAILYNTLNFIPVGHVALNTQLAAIAVQVFAQGFLLGLNVCMPVMAASLLTEIALGIIIRTVPQMNMYVVGIPLKLLIGLTIFGVSIPLLAPLSSTMFDRMFEYLALMFESMVIT